MEAVPRRIELTRDFPVSIRAALNSGTGKILNISSGGVYIATPMYLLPQAQVRLHIDLPESPSSLDAEAVVVWENRGKSRRGDLPPGYGLRFIKLSDQTAHTIDRLIRSPFQKSESGQRRDSATVAFQPFLEEHEREASSGPPYRLKDHVVREQVPEGARGIFVLSYDRTQEAFVGRADDALRDTLMGFVGEYAYFYFEIVNDAEERFIRECELFHRLGGDHGQLDNAGHPGGSPFVCPLCSRPRPAS
jgi:uncharacterized protein (TIGR02266 family)